MYQITLQKSDKSEGKSLSETYRLSYQFSIQIAMIGIIIRGFVTKGK